MSIKTQDKIITKCSSWKEFVDFQNVQPNTTAQGDLFERLVQLYLLTAPQYKSKLSNVWWPKFEELPKGLANYLNLTFPDEGIDLIAETDDGDFWPIQAKYESNTAGAKTKGNLTTFSNAAFNYGENMHLGLVAHTKAKPIRKRYLLESEKKGNKIIELGLSYWLGLDEEDWSAIKVQASGKTYRPKPRSPRSHQETAIKKAKEHFIDNKADRGRLIMPCASGKSLTAYWVARQLNAKSIIVAVPSLSLIKQTVKDWTLEYTADKSKPDWICICSDKSSGKLDDENDDFVKDIYDLGLPVTTNRDIISAFLQKDSKSPKIIFTTYMSGPILSEVAKKVNCAIDFCIFDEAHKTTGRANKKSATLLDENNINIKKRLFMTATERILSGSGKSEKAYSMNDKSVYGECFHTLTFKEAIDEGLICDYKIITMAVSKPEIDELIEEHKFVTNDDGGNEILDASSLAAGIALGKTIETYGAKHAISFHRSIASAKHFNNQQALLSKLGIVSSDTHYSHISSKLSTGERAQVMSEFVSAKKAVVTNAKCLTEGVDIPAIDCVLFASPKQSVVDIVQAAGRAMRPDHVNGKEFGYIVLPVVIPAGVEFEDFANTTEFKVVARQLAALSSQDERIAEYFRLLDKGVKPLRSPLKIVGTVPVGMNINFDDFASAVETKLWDKIGKLNWRPFEDARTYARSLKLRNYKAWRNLILLNQKPADIPVVPSDVYEDWISWNDFLGSNYRNWLQFKEAKTYVHSLNLKGEGEWRSFTKSSDMPENVPKSPKERYSEWVSWGDWLGTGAVASHKLALTWLPFEEARELVRKKGFNSQDEWFEYKKKSSDFPDNVPKDPFNVYKNKGWIDYPDFLGYEKISGKGKKFKKFHDAKKFAKTLKLKNRTDWRKWLQLGEKPNNIPSKPDIVYEKVGWIDWFDWLGVERKVSNFEKHLNWLDFEEARDWARKQNIKRTEDWQKLVKTSGFPDNMPKDPRKAYKGKGFLTMPDFLGYGKVNNNNQTDTKG